MRVLLFNGSPKPRGCTFTVLGEIATVLNEAGIDTEFIQVGGKVMGGCRGCGFCRATKKCTINSDILNDVIDKVKRADGYVFGSPVHYAGASGDIISFMDRLFYSSAPSMAYKPACAVFTCRRGGATASFDQLIKYFTVNNMPVVSSSYWNMAHGNIPEEVVQDKEGMQIMRGLGRNMSWLLKCIEAGKANGIPVPTPEPKEHTNFIR